MICYIVLCRKLYVNCNKLCIQSEPPLRCHQRQSKTPRLWLSPFFQKLKLVQIGCLAGFEARTFFLSDSSFFSAQLLSQLIYIIVDYVAIC